ncbi:type IV pilus assembly protein PilE [Parelusimicrobium proximum]|uniref:type IV pilin protein n=1 Tax=Parelusimicrobium proximum TaxID=3228953 RepID=UPI003D175D51
MRNNKKGFTLIELLVVVLIIAILAAVALPQYTKAVEKSRATEALLNVKAISDAANRTYLIADSYASLSGITGAANMTMLDVQPPTTGKFTYAFGTCDATTCPVTATRSVATTAKNYYIFTYNLSSGGIGTRTCTSANDTALCQGMFGCSNTVGSDGVCTLK